MLDVDVPGLQSAAAEVRTTSAGLRDATATAEGRMAPPGLPGSDAATAARAAATIWQAELRRLTTELDSFGAALGTAVQEIVAADRVSGDDLRQPVPR
ncbi:hypothetical protein [Actinoplanes sp. CA-252034]|uniref:hypothetical protein n=1 Tax=Actinoplanes sp. CA-252034 TaxID=3239906 RepID=UPI003D96E648